MQTLVQLDPNPFIGNATLNNIEEPMKINWIIESAEGNNVVFKSDKGYVTEIIYNGNKYSNDKAQAMRFFFDRVQTDQRLTIRSTDNPDLYYTRTRGYFMMHNYIHDGSTWTIESKGIDPNPFIGNATLSNIEEPITIDWVIESAGGKSVVLKNENGYVKEIVYNGNKYSNDKDQAMRFFFDRVQTDQRLVLKSTDNPDSYYTRARGYFMMHNYIHDGSTWTIETKGIAPTPFLGNVTLDSIEDPFPINWTIESDGGKNVVLKNGNGYVTEIVYNGNKYSSEKDKSMRFFFDRVPTDQRLVLRSTDNPASYYTRTRGYFMMHKYIHDGSTWTVS